MAERIRKSTMVELVDELKKLLEVETREAHYNDLCFMIEEATRGEYHDYKNKKYACGKVASSGHLRAMGFIDLAKRIEDGEFDEEADEEDKAYMRKVLKESGASDRVCKDVFGV